MLALLYNLQSPSNLSLLWNIGSLLGVSAILQIFSGILLSFHYFANSTAFLSVDFIMREVEGGWFLRYLHANGASLMFALLYLHMAKAVYMKSYKMTKTYISGCLLFVMSILIAFLGYVLPWGQMSFWAATVITNLLSAVPYVGKLLVEWLWGGYSMSTVTLERFYSLHFFLPFVLFGLIMLHLVFLHASLSSNPFGTKSLSDLTSPHFLYLSSLFKNLFVSLTLKAYHLMCNSVKHPVSFRLSWAIAFSATSSGFNVSIEDVTLLITTLHPSSFDVFQDELIDLLYAAESKTTLQLMYGEQMVMLEHFKNFSLVCLGPSIFVPQLTMMQASLGAHYGELVTLLP